MLEKILLSRLKILGGINEINYEGTRIQTCWVKQYKSSGNFCSVSSELTVPQEKWNFASHLTLWLEFADLHLTKYCLPIRKNSTNQWTEKFSQATKLPANPNKKDKFPFSIITHKLSGTKSEKRNNSWRERHLNTWFLFMTSSSKDLIANYRQIKAIKIIQIMKSLF